MIIATSRIVWMRFFKIVALENYLQADTYHTDTFVVFIDFMKWQVCM